MVEEVIMVKESSIIKVVFDVSSFVWADQKPCTAFMVSFYVPFFFLLFLLICLFELQISGFQTIVLSTIKMRKNKNLG